MGRLAVVPCLPASWVTLLCPIIARADDGLLREVGTMVVDDYDPACCAFPDLAGQPFRHSLRTRLTQSGGWQEVAPFPLDDQACTSHQIDVAGDNLGDRVDFFYWQGQSFIGDGTFSTELHMASQHPQACECSRDCGNIHHNECRWGADDCEVALIDTCEWLRNWNNAAIRAEIKKVHAGSHLHLGYATIGYVSGKQTPATAGNAFRWRLLGHQPSNPQPIYLAWLNTVRAYQPSGVVGRVSLWQGDCDGDYFQGNWRGWSYGGQPPVCTDQNLDQFDFMDTVSP